MLMFIESLLLLNFNSHPHIEDDGHPDFSFTELKNFNSHPHIEDDYIGSC